MPESTRFGPLAVDADRGPVDRSYWVVEGRFAAGAHPSPPGVGDELIRDLEAGGVDVFVDLTVSAASDTRHGGYGGKLATARHESRPIVDMDVPTPEAMVGTLDVIDAALEQGEGVYVHCAAGLGRTGTVVGCWLVRHGVDADEALDVLGRLRRQDPASARFASPQTDEQVRMVEGWAPDR